LTARVEAVGRHTPTSGIMTLTAADGRSARASQMESGDSWIYRFTPRHGGPHRLHWQGDSKTTLHPQQCSAPIALLGETLGLRLFRPRGTLHFPVPSGVDRFALQVAGAGTAETVKAIVYDASGRAVAQQDNIAAPHVFVLQRQQTEPTEIWCVEFEPASTGVLEDVSVQAHGTPAVFASRPEEVFLAGDHGER
jgi:hypothetical protein